MNKLLPITTLFMLVFFSIGLSASVDDNNSIGKPSDHVDYVVMGKSINHRPVSYTHLTLPTNREV